MSLLLLVTGPNASGKTTTVKTALEPWEGDTRIIRVYADNDGYWKVGPEEMKQKLTLAHQDGAPIILVEGTNRIATAVLELKRTFEAEQRQLAAHVTRSSSTMMRNAIMARCEKNGKKFRADYWTDRVCLYEGSGRYINLMNKYNVRDRKYWDVDATYSYAPALIETLRAQITEELGK